MASEKEKSPHDKVVLSIQLPRSMKEEAVKKAVQNGTNITKLVQKWIDKFLRGSEEVCMSRSEWEIIENTITEHAELSRDTGAKQATPEVVEALFRDLPKHKRNLCFVKLQNIWMNPHANP